MVLSTALSLAAILRRDIAQHRAWMIRGYAIGQGAGTQALTALLWFLIFGTPGELTAMTTGLRTGELLGLRWSDLELNLGIMHINQVAQQVYQKGIVISEPKTEKSRRAIELPSITVGALKSHIERQARIRSTVRVWNDNDLVFPTKRGTPISSRNLLKYFRQALGKAGLPRMTFHSLRHSHSSLLLAAGIHPRMETVEICPRSSIG